MESKFSFESGKINYRTLKYDGTTNDKSIPFKTFIVIQPFSRF